MANHLPDAQFLGAVAQLSCDFLAAAIRGCPQILLESRSHEHCSRMAYDLAQLHIERTYAVRQAVLDREQPALVQ